MKFRQALLARAAARNARIVFAEGEDPRVQLAAERLQAAGIIQPILIGLGGIDPARDPRIARVASHLRDRQPTRVHTTAKVQFEKQTEGFAITRIDLTTEAQVPGIDDATFQKMANGAKEGCPVSKALKATPIYLTAKLQK